MPLLTSTAMLTLSVFTLTCAAAKLPPAPDGKTMAFEKVYEVDFTTDKNGGCKSAKDKLQQAYLEVMDMTYQTIQDIGWLGTLKAVPENKDKTNHNKYLRISQLYKKTFAIEPYSSRNNGLEPEVAEVLSVYEDYLAAHEVDVGTTSPRYHLRCGDEWLVWLAPGAADPREGEQGKPPKYTLAAPKSGKKAKPKGGFWLPGLPKANSILDAADKDYSKVKHPVCTKDTVSFASPENDLIIFCPGAFKSNNPLKKNVWSLDQIEPTAKSGKFSKPTSIDAVDSAVSLDWMHELGHLVKHFEDVRASDHTGGLLPGTEKDGSKRFVYGWKNVVGYAAASDPSETAKASENLAFFAAGMYLKDFYWASGSAKTEPEGGASAGPSRKRDLARCN